MERRRLIAVGIQGPTPPPDSSSGSWVPSGDSKGAVIFGLPARQEDDAEHALLLASSLLNTGRKIVVKELQAEVSATEAKFDWTAEFGNEISLVRQGEALVSPDLAKIYDRRFLLERVEEDDGELFYLRGERKRPARVRGIRARQMPLIGRSAEVARFAELIDQMSQDQGQILGIVGDAGIGKTRLVHSLRQIVAERNIPYAEGSFILHGTERPYHAFQQIVAAISKGTSDTLKQWSLSDVEVDYLRLLLEPDRKIERFASYTDEQIRLGLFQSVRSLLRQAATTPLVIAIEDLHWADPRSFELLESLLDGIEHLRLLLVLIHRPGVSGSWNRRLNYNEIFLKPLSKDDIDRFICTALEIDRVSAKLRELLVRASLGNPLFIEEILRQWLDQKVVEIQTTDDDKKILRASRQDLVALPPTLHSLIAARFDKLSESYREVLRSAALFGVSLNADELEEFLLQIGFENPKEICNELLERNYFEEQSVFPQRIFRFHHDLVFDAIRNTLTEKDRRERHGRIASFLAGRSGRSEGQETDRVANHYLESDGDEEAILWAVRAGDRNLDLFAYAQAERYFRAAVERWETTSPSSRSPLGELFVKWIEALRAIGDFEAVDKALERWKALGLGADPKTLGHYYSARSEVQQARANFADALGDLDVAIRHMKEGSAFADSLGAETKRLKMLWDSGRSNEQCQNDALDLLRRLGDDRPDLQFRIWVQMSILAWNTGQLPESFDYLKRAEALPSDRISPRDRINLHIRFAWNHDLNLDHPSALAHVNKAIQVAEESGLRDQYLMAMCNRGSLYSEVGEYVRALADYETVFREARILGNRQLEARSLIFQADVCLDVGALDEVETIIRRVETEYRVDEQPWLKSLLCRFRYLMAFYRGNVSEAVRLAREDLSNLARVGERLFYLLRYSALLRFETLQHSRPVSEILAEYLPLREEVRKMQMPRLQYSYHGTDYLLAAAGAGIIPPEPKSLNLRSLSAVWLQQMVYANAIRYLASKNEHGKSQSLLEEFRSVRLEMEQKIPLQFLAPFRNHPEFNPERILP
ncbi:MAG TPA: AAA family ATPase [Bdellovibrionota bacterium]|nr:AAA family ATPase [Bdellovibrionota bacterium]